MYEGLTHVHSILRWLVFVALVYAIYQSVRGKSTGAVYAGAGKKTGTIALSLLHLQFVIGLVLYFQSTWFGALQADASAVMGSSEARFFAVEHPLMMLIAVVLGTIGNAKAKRALTDRESYHKRLVWFTITLILILVAIPWPFRFANSGWF